MQDYEVTKLQDGGDVPAPRFGHTATLVGGSRVVLFGGATGDAGRYTITADCYCLEVETNIWSRVPTQKDEPSPSARAAHAAACVDQYQLVIYGGATGGGSLSSDELYLLDFRNEQRSTWMSVPVSGPTPGRRYGHSMVFNKPLLIVCGGNTGTRAESDIWILDVESAPFTWSEVTVMITAKSPCPRVYHSADVCREGPASGMMVIFGGRTTENKSLKDIWGLRQHRDGRWDWVEAPIKRGATPEPRFQATSIFCGSKLLVIGGRGNEVSKALPTSLYDTETCEWRDFTSICRFRHYAWMLDKRLYAYGGFNHKSPSTPTNDLQLLDLSPLDVGGAGGGGGAATAQRPYNSTNTNNAAAAANESSQQQEEAAEQMKTSQMMSLATNNNASMPRSATPPRGQGGQTSYTGAPMGFSGWAGDDIRISNQVYVTHEKDFTHLVQKVAIDSLEDEGRKIHAAQRTLNLKATGDANSDGERIALHVIDHLLKPNDWCPPKNPDSFFLTQTEAHLLCDTVWEVFRNEPVVLQLRAPIKVYGDIHGQFLDLMRHFERYKAPTDGEGGDIDSMDYLFLGDYVDRGSFSLETICLLFALKIKYPKQIHMIRGNHEDPTINAIYGFREECRRRMMDNCDADGSVWQKFNMVFEWLPCGAIIEDRILCIHGGLGGSIHHLNEITTLQRPVKVAQIPVTNAEQKITDLLWSDPSDNDNMIGVTNNETRDPDGTGRIYKFGPDRVTEFLKNNAPLSLIIRAHECVMDGFERFAGGKLITLFSATDYCGHHKNAGALLFVRRDLTIVPKLIYPMDKQAVQQGGQWDRQITMARPPTPPRPAPRARGRGMEGDMTAF